MRNLLWKFVALAGVAGIGIMVVLQAMQGLSQEPELVASQPSAASQTQSGTPHPDEAPLPTLPPLQTKETVALADPFPADPDPPSAPASETPAPVAGNPFTDSSESPEVPTPSPTPTAVEEPPAFHSPLKETPTPVDSQSPTPVDSQSPTPVDSQSPMPVESQSPTPVEPARPEENSVPQESIEPEPTPVEPEVTQPGLPKLPVLVPMKDPAQTPNVEAFSDPPPEAGSAESEAKTESRPVASGLTTEPDSNTESAPFSEPTVVAGDGKENAVPFDPYEALVEPKSESADATPTAAPNITFDSLATTMKSEPADSTPTAAPMPPESPAEAGPMLAKSAESPEFPAQPENERTGSTDSAPSLSPQSAPPLPDSAGESIPSSEVDESVPKPSSAPFDQPSPDSAPENENPAKEVPSEPGKANVQIPSGPVTKEETDAGPASEAPEPGNVNSQLPETPAPKSAGSNDPVPESTENESSEKSPAPEANPFGPPNADPGEPVEDNLEFSPAGNDPDRAEGSEPPTSRRPQPNPNRAEEPAVDPLDQLEYPESVSEQTKPEHHMTVPPTGEASQPSPPPATEPPPASEAESNTGQTPLPEVGPRAGEQSAPPISSSSPDSPKSPESADTSDGSKTASGPQQPKLKIEKIAPPKAALNQPMIYQIVVRNVGQSAALQVVVEDQVPQGTRLTGTIPRGEMAKNRLIWRFDKIPPGEEKKIAVRIIPTKEGQIGSVAKVSFVAEVAARTVVAAPKLKLDLTGPTNAVLGDALTYHFELANVGSGDAGNVYLRNILPEGLAHPNGDDLEYEVGLLKAGEKKGIDLTVNAAKEGVFSNKAILTAKGGLKSEATAKVKILGDRLTITRTGPKRRYVGRKAEYSNTITNQTDTKVAPVRVTEVVPAGMEFVKANAGGQYDPKKRTVTWSLEELGPQENQKLTLELLAKKEGPQSSEVTAFDPNGSRAVVKSQTTVDGYTALRLDVAEYQEPIDVGDQVGFRVVATNRGTRASTNVVVHLTLPEEMEFVSAKGPVDFQRKGRTLTFNPIKSLDAQAELEFDLVLKSRDAGDARLRLEIGSDQTETPLLREEGIRILAKRP